MDGALGAKETGLHANSQPEQRRRRWQRNARVSRMGVWLRPATLSDEARGAEERRERRFHADSAFFVLGPIL